MNKEKKLNLNLFKKLKMKATSCKDPILLIQGKDFHEGVMGIVASRIKDKYNKPCIIISINGNIGKGSARSVFGFDIGNYYYFSCSK